MSNDFFLHYLKGSCGFFPLLCWCDVLHCFIFHIMNHVWIPGKHPTWPCYVILSICCWILFANISLKIFTSIFNREIGLYFSSSAFCFSYQGNLRFINFKVSSPLESFGGVWKELVFKFLSMFGRIHQGDHPVLRSCSLGDLFNDLIFLPILLIFFKILSWLKCVGWIFLIIYPFLVGSNFSL